MADASALKKWAKAKGDEETEDKGKGGKVPFPPPKDKKSIATWLKGKAAEK